MRWLIAVRGETRIRAAVEGDVYLFDLSQQGVTDKMHWPSAADCDEGCIFELHTAWKPAVHLAQQSMTGTVGLLIAAGCDEGLDNRL